MIHDVVRASCARENLRRDLRTAVVALCVAVVVMATPSVADRITNADKVDGKDAVGAGAPIAKRKGKLVATNNQGRLPGNIIAKAPDADRVDGIDSAALVGAVARPGSVQTGAFSAWGGGAGSYISDAITLRSSLPVGIPLGRVTFLADGDPFTAECPGYRQVVPRGWACLYEVNAADSFLDDPFDGTISPTVDGIGPTGFHLYATCTDVSCYTYGGWAIRAGSAADVGPRPGPSRRSIP